MDSIKYYEIGVEIQPMRLKNLVNINLEYHLIKGKCFDEAINKDVDTYGVKIVKKEFLLNNEVKQEEECAYHLSKSKDKVEDLLKCLSRNSVTPIGLYSVLDNLIGISY